MLCAVGYGAYAVPFLLALVGIYLIIGPLKAIPRNIGIGSFMLFGVFIVWESLYHDIPEDPWNGGGWIGNAFASGIRVITKDTIGYILLMTLAVIAVIIIVDIPLADLIDRIRLAWGEVSDAALERAEMRREAMEKRNGTKPKPVEVAQESRKRTLASIFGKKGEPAEEAAGAEAAAVAVKPPVKISMPMPLKAEKSPRNGESNGHGENAEPIEQGEFQLPPTTLLTEPPPPPPRVESELKANIEIIERTLGEFNVEANVVEIACGPTVARYEIQLAPGIKVKKIVSLADDLALKLAAIDVRVEAPIPGKAAIGIEVPNKNRGTVVIREIVESKPFREATSKLTFALGKDVSGHPIVADLAKMPHMLIGGATNSGKSVGLNTLVASLLFRATPDELKLVLIDPKRVELSLFDGIPHLACPVVKDAKLAASVFRAVVQEMDRRYLLLGQVSVRHIAGYNEKVQPTDRLPYMVVVVDELNDLMMQAAAEIEGSITRIAQLARAVGIHLVIATQRPSVDVITGVIKANISSRIAFGVSSYHDSKTIIDQKGAERLVGRGDMLFLPMDAPKPVRIQGCYISEKEIEDLCNFLKEQRKPIYTIQPGQVPGSSDGGHGGGEGGVFADEFYEPAVRLVVRTGYCSTSIFQRRFNIGYNRAARIVDAMEQQGIVGPLEGAGTKGRRVLISKADLDRMFGGQLGLAPDDDDEVPPAEVIYPDNEEEEN